MADILELEGQVLERLTNDQEVSNLVQSELERIHMTESPTPSDAAVDSAPNPTEPDHSREERAADFMKQYLQLQNKLVTEGLSPEEQVVWNMMQDGLNAPAAAETLDPRIEAERLKQEGNKAFQNQDYEAALDFYNRADALLPDQAAVLSNRSATNRELGHLEQAVADAQAVVSLKPDWFRGYQRLHSALNVLERYAAAEQALRDGLEACPEGREGHDALLGVLNGFLERHSVPQRTASPVAGGVSESTQPNIPETEQTGNAGSPAPPEPVDPLVIAESFREAGNAAFQKQQYRVALDAYNKANELNSQDERVLSNRSATHAGLGDFEMALADALKVIELKPSWFRGHVRVATALRYLRRFEEAEVACLKGLSLCPDDANLTDLLKTVRVDKEKAEEYRRSKEVPATEPVPAPPAEVPPESSPPEETEDRTEEEISKFNFEGEDFQDLVEEAWVRSRYVAEKQAAPPEHRLRDLLTVGGAVVACVVAVRAAKQYLQ